jgi:hypothetical protein
MTTIEVTEIDPLELDELTIEEMEEVIAPGWAIGG